MNKHDIIYRRANYWLLPVWISQTQIDALDAVRAEHGRKWRSIIELRWYNGTASGIGAEVYAIRNNLNQGWRALDLYMEIKKGAVTVERFIRVAPTKVIEEAAIIQSTGAPRYNAAMYDSENKHLLSVDLTTLEDIANWHDVIMKASEEVSRTHELERAYLWDGVTGEVIEAYDPLLKTAVS